MIANILFPGTSTIQTRARYFLFVPWIYQRLERRKVPSSDIARRARNDEITLIYSLIEAGEKEGVIGIEAKGSLKRLPSNIYWLGMAAWGIRLYTGSQSQYHRYLDSYYRAMSRYRDGPDDESEGGSHYNWHPGLPSAPGGFPNSITFELSLSDAEYLQERIINRVRGTFLEFIVTPGKIVDSVEFPWEHPQYGEFSRRIQEQLIHARNFSEAIHGAALLYNLLLAEKRRDSELSDQYRKRIVEWSATIRSRRSEFTSWDRNRFWRIVRSNGARIWSPTKRFVDRWLDIALSTDKLERIAENKSASRLIQEREQFLKRSLARLSNPRALDLWTGAEGKSRLSRRNFEGPASILPWASGTSNSYRSD